MIWKSSSGTVKREHILIYIYLLYLLSVIEELFSLVSQFKNGPPGGLFPDYSGELV